MEHPRTEETYTIPEAAEALGRSTVNFRRWLDNDLVPLPYLKETIHGHKVYTVGELEIIAQELAVHEREFATYGRQHEAMQHRIFQRMQGYRNRFI